MMIEMQIGKRKWKWEKGAVGDPENLTGIKKSIDFIKEMEKYTH